MELQACALHHFWASQNNNTEDSTRQEVFDFIWCTFKNRHLEGAMNAVERCANDHIHVDAWPTIHGCYLEGNGKALVADNVKITKELTGNVEYFSLPTVLIKGENVTGLSAIKAKICELYVSCHLILIFLTFLTNFVG